MKILFELTGGPNDGTILQGTLGESSDAERWYLFSNRGAVGQRIKVASQYAVDALASNEHSGELHQFQRHYYVVTDRVEEGDEVCIRAEYVQELDL